jgi:hypothetical protein
MRLILVDHGYPFKKIMKGRDWIGRVAKMGDGSGYLGVIGKLSVKMPTERQAFEEVGAQYMGHRSADTLHRHNRDARRVKRVINQAADYAINQMEHRNFEPLEKMLMTAPTATAVVGAFTRSLKRTSNGHK